MSKSISCDRCRRVEKVDEMPDNWRTLDGHDLCPDCVKKLEWFLEGDSIDGVVEK